MHPGVDAGCLDPRILGMAWHNYRSKYQDPYNGPQYTKDRHLAYSQRGQIDLKISSAQNMCSVASMCCQNDSTAISQS